MNRLHSLEDFFYIVQGLSVISLFILMNDAEANNNCCSKGGSWGMVVLEAEEDALGRDRGARQSAIEKSRRPGSWDTWRPSL